jgi:hypothetical protein
MLLVSTGVLDMPSSPTWQYITTGGAMSHIVGAETCSEKKWYLKSLEWAHHSFLLKVNFLSYHILSLYFIL